MSENQSAAPHLFSTVTFKQILFIWLPLTFSWMLMLIEGPFLNGVLARMEGPELAIAALGVVMSVATVMESMIVPLLTTSTALSKNRQHYLVLKRFSMILIVFTVGLHAIMSWTPLYDLIIVRLIGIPENMIEGVRWGLRIMTPWSGFVAWRRVNQGILIRHGQSNKVGTGTIVRLLAMGLSALGVGFLTKIPGVLVGAIASNMGVLAEAIYAEIVTRPLIRSQFFSPSSADDSLEPLTYRALTAFHIPLFFSSLLFFLTRPMISAALARTADPTITLAAWSVLMGLQSIVRAPSAAYPSAVVALAERKNSFKPLSNFTWFITAFSTITFALVAYVPALQRLYFHSLMGVSAELTKVALSGVAISMLMPIASCYAGFLKGILTARKHTVSQMVSTAASMAAMAGGLALGIALKLPGIPMGAAASVLSYLADLVVLLIFYRRLVKKEARALALAPAALPVAE